MFTFYIVMLMPVPPSLLMLSVKPFKPWLSPTFILSSSGVRQCFTTPCFTLDQTKVESWQESQIQLKLLLLHVPIHFWVNSFFSQNNKAENHHSSSCYSIVLLLVSLKGKGDCWHHLQFHILRFIFLKHFRLGCCKMSVENGEIKFQKQSTGKGTQIKSQGVHWWLHLYRILRFIA